MSLASTVKNAATTPPVAQTAMAGLIGGLVTGVLQLLQTYVPHFHQPPAATTALIVTVLTVAASHLTTSAASASSSTASSSTASSSTASSSAPAAITPAAAPPAEIAPVA